MGQIFEKVSILVKFSKKLEFSEIFEKKSILVMFWKKSSILFKISEKCGFFWKLRKKL